MVNWQSTMQANTEAIWFNMHDLAVSIVHGTCNNTDHLVLKANTYGIIMTVILNAYARAWNNNVSTVPLDLNFTNARVQKATARNIHSNAPE